MHRGYGISFNGIGKWSFYNDYSRNAVIFHVDNSSSSHAYNCKSNLLALKIKQEQTFALVYIVMGIIVIFLLTENKSLSLKLVEKLTFRKHI